MTTANEEPKQPFELHDFPHELTPQPQKADLLDLEDIDKGVSEEIFPDDIETAKEVH